MTRPLGKTEALSTADTAEYIADLTKSLADLAAANGLAALNANLNIVSNQARHFAMYVESAVVLGDVQTSMDLSDPR